MISDCWQAVLFSPFMSNGLPFDLPGPTFFKVRPFSSTSCGGRVSRLQSLSAVGEFDSTQKRLLWWFRRNKLIVISGTRYLLLKRDSCRSFQKNQFYIMEIWVNPLWCFCFIEHYSKSNKRELLISVNMFKYVLCFCFFNRVIGPMNYSYEDTAVVITSRSFHETELTLKWTAGHKGQKKFMKVSRCY